MGAVNPNRTTIITNTFNPVFILFLLAASVASVSHHLNTIYCLNLEGKVFIAFFGFIFNASCAST
jgi:hypothetical protein